MRLLIDNLINRGWLKTPRIIEAFRKIDRADFVPARLKEDAYIDAPLPIGYGQTVSQPSTVAFMLELLQPEAGDKVLDIGSGSGWQTAMLSHIVGGYCLKSKILSRAKSRDKNFIPSEVEGQKSKTHIKNKKINGCGEVFAVERILELMELGKKNIEKYNFIEKGIVKIVCQDGCLGLPREAPFDKIIAAASGEEIPKTWKDQLKIGGRLVTPRKSSILLIVKKEEGKFEEEEYPGFVFVPLIRDL